jgi:hypothetical protein
MTFINKITFFVTYNRGDGQQRARTRVSVYAYGSISIKKVYEMQYRR